MEIEIIAYQPIHKKYFESLNKAWIEKYFFLEEIDKKVLAFPEEYIFKDGGKILMAKMGNKVVGTVALKKMGERVYEMTKMAVDEKYRGKKIGFHLAKALLETANKLKAKKVILFSNTALVPAISLYRKIGFKEVPMEPGIYQRCNIKMEYDSENEALI